MKDDPCFGKHAVDETVDERPARQNFRLLQEQQDEYLERVREWNADPSSDVKTIENFLSFVGLQWG
ncbi:MAG: hypothetical protein HW388_1002 [Dehalococcoidia bacterium]|nr:hypothetical protein [Dehalococcoidia bacterium]